MKLSVMIATFSYGGNGGAKSTLPEIGDWLAVTLLKMRADPRIGSIKRPDDFADCPIPMMRNRAVLVARQLGCDVLLMIDSDQIPDVELKDDPTAKPFWDTSFDFLYQHYAKGPCVIGAPYCGPPPQENVYCFRWASQMNDSPDDGDFQLGKYSREEAQLMAGIQECPALPTGLVLYDVRAFDLIEPRPKDAVDRILKALEYRWPEGRPMNRRELVEMVLREKTRQERPFFYYEYGGDFEERYEASKSSTEDVTNTRDIAIAGRILLGYTPVYCNWDAWAGHVKPKVVRKPRMLTCDVVSDKLQRAARERLDSGTRIVQVATKIGEEIDWSRVERFAGEGGDDGEARQAAPAVRGS